LKPAGSAFGAIAVMVLAGSGLGSVGFSFDAAPSALGSVDRPLGDRLPRPAAPPAPAVKGIGAYADPVIRAKSYFDAETGQLCYGTGIDRTCR
jgi:hypothetical protein